MRDYDRDEYEDYEDYEDEGQEAGEEYEEEGEGEEYEEEEPPKPTKEELEYLELRQKLKDAIRKEMKKESGASLTDSSARNKKLPYDNYGSFFGPSQPVIAHRVIQESKSLLENPNLSSRRSNSSHINKNTNKVSNGGGLKSSAHSQLPKVSEKQVKAQKLKVTRDYSFLLSDDAELPAPTKEHPSQNTSVRNSEGRPSQVAGRSKQPSINGAKLVRSSGDDRKLVSGGGRLPPKSESNHKLISTRKPSKLPADSRKQLGSNSGNGPGQPVGPKGLPSKMPASTMVNKSSTPGMKNPVNGMKKPIPPKVHTSVPKRSLEQRKDVREQNRPKMITEQNRPKMITEQNRLKMITEQNKPKMITEQNKPKMIMKQPVPSSKAQIGKPLKQNPVPKHSDSNASRDHRPKNKVVKRPFDDMEDDMDVSRMIRSMFNYNPNKFVDDDDDDNMEAGFDEIMKEEMRSAQIARKEDEEQLRLIEEEEERERRRRTAKLKKRRLGE